MEETGLIMSVSSRIRMQVVRSVAPAEGSGQHVHRQHQRQTWLTHHWCRRFWPLVHATYRHVRAVRGAGDGHVSFIEFPITPVTWLKYDPSGIVCLVAGFAYGPAAAAIVSVLGFVPHLFTNPWGSLMAVLVALFLSVPAAFIYNKNSTRKGAAIGIMVGAVVALAVAHRGNIIVTPFYAHMTTAQLWRLSCRRSCRSTR